MSMDDIYLTRLGHEKLMDDLEYLKTTRRREISKSIAEARAHGDISENAEYDAAKDAQGHNEKKIAELEDKLSRAKIIDDSHFATDEVLIGASVKIKDMVTGDEFVYMLVAEEEADFSKDKISVLSPVGRGLLNHKVGEEFNITIPAGVLKYKVLEITR